MSFGGQARLHLSIYGRASAKPPILLHFHGSLYQISVGESPSGKAPASGAGIRGFESLLPSQHVHATVLPIHYKFLNIARFESLLDRVYSGGMADDKKNIGKPDRNLISFKEKYEFNYAVNQLQKQVPDTTKQEAKDALTKAAKKVSPSEGREKIMRAARKDLRS